ncbi:hypothetical protein A1O3_02136 [Capronia epimyces CBS 606.96]|uniref:3-hydroxyisobutyrate dehydrogenase n=1 Tax=Capronia epimyces CBS 606.96 TaxID=1182542 RepID=W9Y893_9EURO|nr:uncharacterized protein A1O3_02136 [Capronia epimyces CBS 606.96]EXJ89072.1 hypothetical protein A1O3_02136 [Capronia epimyces CBS 606.96]
MADNHNYAFVGLGAMGFGMASNIRKKIPSSSILYIYDVYQPTCDKFVAEFGQYGPIEITQSGKEVAANAQVLISSLPSLESVRTVYLDETTGVVAAPANPDRLLLECSTIESSVARELGEKLAAAKAGVYVDTPVSGGAPAATAGKLSFMIGHANPNPNPDSKPAEGSGSGSDPIGQRIQDVLSFLGEPQKFFWCGPLGAGLAAKISNNYISCTVFLVVAEAMAIGARSGIDPALLSNVIRNSSGQTFMGDIVTSVPKELLESKNGFPAHLMIKDLGLGVDVGKATGVTPHMALAALDIWKQAAEDPAVVVKDGFPQFKKN